MPGPVEAVLVGAGNRGARVYGAYALANPERLRFVAVVDPDDARRGSFAAAHGIPTERQFGAWEELAGRQPLVPTVFNATLDGTHRASTLGLLAAGYDVLLEKPIATTPEDVLEVAQAAERHGRMLQISHVLRYAPFFKTIHDVVRAGDLGDVVSIDWRENLVYWHYAHSFVRGNWSNATRTAPMLLTKCCHDLDLLVWMLGSTCERIASYGEQRHFTSAKVGPEVPARCTDGCPYAEQCLHYAPRLYLSRLAEDPHNFTVNAITLDHTEAGVLRALETGPYGRCVYRCDNDVVDHQAVLMHFGGGQAVTLTMQGASYVEGRTVRIDGTRATLLANEARNEICVIEHGTAQRRDVDIPAARGGHGGGDWGLIEAFLSAVRGERDGLRTSARESVESHLMAFAAEEARVAGTTVVMADFRACVQQRVAV
ncbi:MAG TPA: Gfo/Idh/MocA family oxidoreductase [Chloroflexota bacterium]